MDNRKIIEEIDNLDGEENKKKTNKNGIRIVTLLAIIALIVVVIVAFYKITNNQRKANEAMERFKEYLSLTREENDDISYMNEDINSDYELLEDEDIIDEIDEEKAKTEIANIKIAKEFRDINKNLGIVLNNQNSEVTLGMLLQVIFYNAENKPIKIDSVPIEVLEKNLDYYIIFEETPKDFSRYEFLITKEFDDSEYISLKNDVAFEVKDENEDEIIITGENNSKELLEFIEFSILYYDESNNIIGVNRILESDIMKNDIFKIEACNYLIDEETGEYIKPFRYEVILNSAYSYVY